MLFILLALVLFTIGFRLVKLGNPYKRGGGDPYTKRRMFRMLGWMMWTCAAVLVVLSIVNQVFNGQPPDVTAIPQSGARSQGLSIPMEKLSTQFIPNLLANPTLQANSGGSGATNSPDLNFTSVPSLKFHRAFMEVPTLMKPLADMAMQGGQSPSVVAPTQPPPPGPSAPAGGAVPLPDPTGHRALEMANYYLLRDPTNVVGYLQRGNLFLTEKKMDLAKLDFEHALRIKSDCAPAIFGIAEIAFVQGHYDDARPGFLAIEGDINYGDLAKYKVFLCDLFGGHQDAATRELAVFNDAGSDASYYFANMAWSFYHKKNGDAQNWWQSAVQIFSPQKLQIYAKPLIEHGYNPVAS